MLQSDPVIVIIDDTPIWQTAARQVLQRMGVAALIPETPLEVDDIDADKMQLAVLDRMLSPTWSEAVGRLEQRLPKTCQRWEWTVATDSDAETIRDLRLVKQDGTTDTLKHAVAVWVAKHALGSAG